MNKLYGEVLLQTLSRQGNWKSREWSVLDSHEKYFIDKITLCKVYGILGMKTSHVKSQKFI